MIAPTHPSQVAQQQPFYEQPNGWRAGLAACTAHPACRAGRALSREQHCQLLLAAICCRDDALCTQLIEGAEEGCWGCHATNCHLLVAAAEHEMPAVLSALLALRTAGGRQPFSPGMSHEGCSPLAAAAERNSRAALRLLLARGADVNAVGLDGLAPLHWAVIGGACEAAELLLQAGARWVLLLQAGARRVLLHSRTMSPRAMRVGARTGAQARRAARRRRSMPFCCTSAACACTQACGWPPAGRALSENRLTPPSRRWPAARTSRAASTAAGCTWSCPCSPPSRRGTSRWFACCWRTAHPR